MKQIKQQGLLPPSSGLYVVAEAIPNFLMVAGNYGRKEQFIPTRPVQNLFDYHSRSFVLTTCYQAHSELIAYESVDVRNDSGLVLLTYLISVGNMALDSCLIHDVENFTPELCHSLLVFYEMRVFIDFFKAVFLNQGLIVDSFIEHNHQDLFCSACISGEDSPNFSDNILSSLARPDLLYASPHHLLDSNSQLNCKVVIFFRFLMIAPRRVLIMRVILGRGMAIGRVGDLNLWPLAQVLLVSDCQPRKKINWIKIHAKLF